MKVPYYLRSTNSKHSFCLPPKCDIDPMDNHLFDCTKIPKRKVQQKCLEAMFCLDNMLAQNKGWSDQIRHSILRRLLNISVHIHDAINVAFKVEQNIDEDEISRHVNEQLTACVELIEVIIGDYRKWTPEVRKDIFSNLKNIKFSLAIEFELISSIKLDSLLDDSDAEFLPEKYEIGLF